LAAVAQQRWRQQRQQQQCGGNGGSSATTAARRQRRGQQGNSTAAAAELLQPWAAAAAALVSLLRGGTSCGGSMTKEKCGKKSIWQTHKIWRRWPANAARFWGKSKKRKQVFLFNNLALLNLDFVKKKIAKKGKKRQKTNYGSRIMDLNMYLSDLKIQYVI
jgi:hypothetical protein